MLPWAPLPHNNKRDAAHARMRAIYTDIINDRRHSEKGDNTTQTSNMISNLMNCTYKTGQSIPDKEIAHMMITLLMAGQHSSSSIGSWIMLRLAAHPEVIEELYQEQLANLDRDGKELPPLRYQDLDRLPLHQNVIRETLRLHSSIHSLMRKVKNPLHVAGTPYIISTSHVLLASPGVTALSDHYFPNASKWDPHRWDKGNQKDDNDDMNEEVVDYGYGAVSKGTSSPYLPFGAGRHRCIGEKFAYVNLGVIVATIVRHVRFFNVDGKKGVLGTDYSSLFPGPVKPAVIGWERRDGQRKI